MVDTVKQIALLLHPDPKPEHVSPPEAYNEALDHVEGERWGYEHDLAAAVDGGDADPILEALARLAATIEGAEHQRRIVLAYARHFAAGRRHSLEALGRAARLSPSGVRTAYRDEDVAYVRATLAGPTVAADPELAAMNALTEAADETRADVLARVVTTLPSEAAARVRTWAISRYGIEQ
ncbi:hypothetical protein [Phytomonospora endophytica]|uniref:Uncharacterized protein n=1 Tax=Phytomonospora endophytica TaxID=714109 RepID=A0A841FQJ4_9ACTN|nr:hypothetical protein [Phytomonospora endophytica]MBB6039561.1 hypothetical protein [Phytomonospora endophytica]GIG70526.1 hypothetical protein Pen01_68210 [Phytomonospora endophytica]